MTPDTSRKPGALAEAYLMNDEGAVQLAHAIADLRALMARCEALEGALRGVMSVLSVTEASVGLSGEEYPLRVCGMALGPDVDERYLAARALLAGKDGAK
jgi:hypothetical protein